MTLRLKILGHIIKKVGWRIRHSQAILKVRGRQNREWEDSKKQNIYILLVAMMDTHMWRSMITNFLKRQST